MKILGKLFFALSILFISHVPAMALETPIGLPQSLYGMEIAAVYLQAIEIGRASCRERV